MKEKFLVRAAAIFVVLTLMFSLAACGVKTSTAGAVKDSKQAAVKLEKIKEKGKIVVGTSADYPPYEFIKEVNGRGEIVGFDIEIAKAIAKDLGVELEIKDMKFEGLLAALVAEDIDFIAAGMVPDAERDKSVDFSVQFYQANQNLLIRTEDAQRITSIEALKGLTVGAQKATTQEDIAKEKTEAGEIKSLGKITDLVLELTNKKIDAVVLVEPVAKAYARQNPKVAVSNISLGAEEGVALAVNEGNSDLLEAINKSLNRMMKDGTIERYIQEATMLAEQQE